MWFILIIALACVGYFIFNHSTVVSTQKQSEIADIKGDESFKEIIKQIELSKKIYYAVLKDRVYGSTYAMTVFKNSEKREGLPIGFDVTMHTVVSDDNVFNSYFLPCFRDGLKSCDLQDFLKNPDEFLDCEKIDSMFGKGARLSKPEHRERAYVGYINGEVIFRDCTIIEVERHIPVTTKVTAANYVYLLVEECKNKFSNERIEFVKPDRGVGVEFEGKPIGVVEI